MRGSRIAVGTFVEGVGQEGMTPPSLVVIVRKLRAASACPRLESCSGDMAPGVRARAIDPTIAWSVVSV